MGRSEDLNICNDLVPSQRSQSSRICDYTLLCPVVVCPCPLGDKEKPEASTQVVRKTKEDLKTLREGKKKKKVEYE